MCGGSGHGLLLLVLLRIGILRLHVLLLLLLEAGRAGRVGRVQLELIKLLLPVLHLRYLLSRPDTL